MAVIKSVRQHIGLLHADTIIFTKDLLHYGSRESVDMCLHRLALSGFLKRVSFGMYVRHDCSRSFTTAEITDAKKIWLIQQRLTKLVTASPGLILSSMHKQQNQQVENFAPPTVAATNDLQRPTTFTAQTNSRLSPFSR